MAMSNNQMVTVLSLWNLWFCWKKTTPMPNLPVMSMGDGIGLSELACFSIWKSKRLRLGPEDLKILVLFLYYLRIFIFINPKKDQGFIPTVWCHKKMFGSSCTMLDSLNSPENSPGLNRILLGGWLRKIPLKNIQVTWDSNLYPSVN